MAQVIKVPRSRVNNIVLGRWGITTDTALPLARYFGTSAEFWVNLQAHYDLEIASRTLRRKIEREVSPRGLITTFEWAGIEFIDNNGGGEGVRFRRLAGLRPGTSWRAPLREKSIRFE